MFGLTLASVTSTFWVIRRFRRATLPEERFLYIGEALVALLVAETTFRQGLTETGMSNSWRAGVLLGILVVGIAFGVILMFDKLNKEEDQTREEKGNRRE